MLQQILILYSLKVLFKLLLNVILYFNDFKFSEVQKYVMERVINRDINF